MITRQTLDKAFPSSLPTTREWLYGPLSRMLEEFGIDESKERLAGFFANVFVETGGLKTFVENLYYTEARLKAVWPSRDLARFARNPEALANNVYANRMGNGPESSGDGWKYRGRGLKMLTGKENYEKFQKANRHRLPENFDVVANPDLILGPEWMVLSACWYWVSRGCNELMDQGNFKRVCYVINGGYVGYDDRLKQYNRLLKIL